MYSCEAMGEVKNFSGWQLRSNLVNWLKYFNLTVDGSGIDKLINDTTKASRSRLRLVLKDVSNINISRENSMIYEIPVFSNNLIIYRFSNDVNSIVAKNQNAEENYFY